MVNVFSGLSRREYSFLSGFFKTKNLLNLSSVNGNPKSLKLFSVSSGNPHYRRYDRLANQNKELPSLFYIQNPITWLINKVDFFMLRSAWDADFVEEDFKHGVRQAVSLICTLISNNLWNNLRGLVTNRTLARLQRDVDVNWEEDKRRNIAIEPSDIKLLLPRKVYFLKIADQKFVDVDVICVAMKFREQLHPLNNADIILIEVLARFHRNYTAGQLPNWTVTLFKVLMAALQVLI